MDYEKEYRNALERAKKGLPIDEVFPELKESDDEKTRQMIVNTLRDAFISERISKTSYTEMLAYLEKQKEKWWKKAILKVERMRIFTHHLQSCSVEPN